MILVSGPEKAGLDMPALDDHVTDIITGKVPVEGIDITYLNFEVEEIFYRFAQFREWHVSEMSMATYISLVSQGDRSITAIPVFPSRFFRPHAFYVATDRPIEPDRGRIERVEAVRKIFAMAASGAGTSAIAAALTAAAEVRRQNGGGSAGFERIAELPRFMAEPVDGRSRLLRLFQPRGETAPLFEIALAWIETKRWSAAVEAADGRGRRGFLQLSGCQTAVREAALLAKRDQLVGNSLQLLRFRQRGDDALVVDQRRQLVAEHRLAMLGGAVELAMNLAVTHLKSSFSSLSRRSVARSGGLPAFAR